MSTGLRMRDVWRESLAVAARAGVSWYKRPFFAWRVVRRWKRHNSLEIAINDALSAYVWDHLK